MTHHRSNALVALLTVGLLSNAVPSNTWAFVPAAAATKELPAFANNGTPVPNEYQRLHDLMRLIIGMQVNAAKLAMLLPPTDSENEADLGSKTAVLGMTLELSSSFAVDLWHNPPDGLTSAEVAAVVNAWYHGAGLLPLTLSPIHWLAELRIVETLHHLQSIERSDMGGVPLQRFLEFWSFFARNYYRIWQRNEFSSPTMKWLAGSMREIRVTEIAVNDLLATLGEIQAIAHTVAIPDEPLAKEGAATLYKKFSEQTDSASQRLAAVQQRLAKPPDTTADPGYSSNVDSLTALSDNLEAIATSLQRAIGELEAIVDSGTAWPSLKGQLAGVTTNIGQNLRAITETVATQRKQLAVSADLSFSLLILDDLPARAQAVNDIIQGKQPLHLQRLRHMVDLLKTLLESKMLGALKNLYKKQPRPSNGVDLLGAANLAGLDSSAASNPVQVLEHITVNVDSYRRILLSDLDIALRSLEALQQSSHWASAAWQFNQQGNLYNTARERRHWPTFALFTTPAPPPQGEIPSSRWSLVDQLFATNENGPFTELQSWLQELQEAGHPAQTRPLAFMIGEYKKHGFGTPHEPSINQIPIIDALARQTLRAPADHAPGPVPLSESLSLLLRMAPDSGATVAANWDDNLNVLAYLLAQTQNTPGHVDQMSAELAEDINKVIQQISARGERMGQPLMSEHPNTAMGRAVSERLKMGPAARAAEGGLRAPYQRSAQLFGNRSLTQALADPNTHQKIAATLESCDLFLTGAAKAPLTRIRSQLETRTRHR